jgi:hypothetical protein
VLRRDCRVQKYRTRRRGLSELRKPQARWPTSLVSRLMPSVLALVMPVLRRLEEYEGDAVRRVFEALGPVLPDKAPWPDRFNRYKLIYESPRR